MIKKQTKQRSESRETKNVIRYFTKIMMKLVVPRGFPRAVLKNGDNYNDKKQPIC